MTEVPAYDGGEAEQHINDEKNHDDIEGFTAEFIGDAIGQLANQRIDTFNEEDGDKAPEEDDKGRR